MHNIFVEKNHYLNEYLFRYSTLPIESYVNNFYVIHMNTRRKVFLAKSTKNPNAVFTGYM